MILPRHLSLLPPRRIRRYFLIGCNAEPVWGFDEWAARVGCGIEPLDGPLLIHTAWTGSLDGTLTGKGSIRRDMEALIDSFLVSQDTTRARLIVWWMDRDPDPSDPLEARCVIAPHTLIAPVFEGRNLCHKC
jgi:hypothetical protein